MAKQRNAANSTRKAIITEERKYTRRLYWDQDEAEQAKADYDAIEHRRDRRLYKFIMRPVIDGKQVEVVCFVIAAGRSEAVVAVMDEWGNAECVLINPPAYIDPRPKLEHDIRICQGRLVSLKSVIEEFESVPNPDPNVKFLIKKFKDEVEALSFELEDKEEEFNHIKDMQYRDVVKAHKDWVNTRNRRMYQFRIKKQEEGKNENKQNTQR